MSRSSSHPARLAPDFFLNSAAVAPASRPRRRPVRPRRGARGGPPKNRSLIDLKRPGTSRARSSQGDEEDLDQEDHNGPRAGRLRVLRQRIEARELPMDLAEVDVAFAGNRILFFFSAERRVTSASWSRTWGHYRADRAAPDRGARPGQAPDGCGPWGGRSAARPSCANSTRSRSDGARAAARAQPGQDLGACGRLMCCLSYELAQYRHSAAGCRRGRGAQDARGDEGDPREVFQEVVWLRDDEAASTGSRSPTCRPAPTTNAATATAEEAAREPGRRVAEDGS